MDKLKFYERSPQKVKQRYETEIFLNEYSFAARRRNAVNSDSTLLNIKDVELIGSSFNVNLLIKKTKEIQQKQQSFAKDSRSKLRSILSRKERSLNREQKYEGIFAKCKTTANSLENHFEKKTMSPSKVKLQPLQKSAEMFYPSKKKKNEIKKKFNYTKCKNFFQPKKIIQQKKTLQQMQIRYGIKSRQKDESFRKTHRTSKGPSPWHIADQVDFCDFL